MAFRHTDGCLPESEHARGELLEGRVGLGVQAVAHVDAIRLAHPGGPHILSVQAHEGKQQVIHHCMRIQLKARKKRKHLLKD